MQPNYFTCTLGQAATLGGIPKTYRTISEFLTYQANKSGDLPAVGFPIPNKETGHWGRRILSFGDIDNATRVLAGQLLQSFEPLYSPQRTVALLCHSSPEFLFAWLSLIRLGHSVLLIAPQCQPAAIVHLCKSCDVQLLLHDTVHMERAAQAVNASEKSKDANFIIGNLPLHETEDISELVHQSPQYTQTFPDVEESTTAYLHHTSGTSSGLPKPIPQSHRAAIGVLTHLPETPPRAAFTTTPLYHGGIADLFRSWTSDSLIWLFPGKDIPITARNIYRCLEIAKPSLETSQTLDVKFFSSVPYVLQMMESEETDLRFLKSMDIVGVGGAALPIEVGNQLVEQGVHLISRFGSAECGFILSSHRDFSSDREWQYLRNYNPPKLVEFESRDDGLSELIIKPGWPHVAKQNRPDGSFATADLLAAHPTIQNAWLYHSRADSQLTLITGKKFDPAPVEAAIATSALLDDVLIFGDNRPFPGALLLRSKDFKDVSDEELLCKIRPVVKRSNAESQDHARIPLDMLVPLPYQSEPLEKSSKGTIIRKSAEKRFGHHINGAYELQDLESTVEHVGDESVVDFLMNVVTSLTSNSTELREDTDLFAYGVDSILSTQLRSRVQRLLPNQRDALPLSVVEDTGSVQALADFVLQRRRGKDVDTKDELQLMMELVKDFSSFDQDRFNPDNKNHTRSGSGQVVVLTGTTGALGAHILGLLRSSESTSAIYCLVRGPNETAVRGRVNKALEQKGLDGLTSKTAANHKIKVVQAQLGEPRLGLSDAVYNHLATEADLIVHVAWNVNFRLRLQSFVRDDIAGVRNLLDLALRTARARPPRFAYCSSTSAIINAKTDASKLLPECIIQDPASASPLGYARSKWVAEHICLEANKKTSLRGNISVIRVGQLAGDSSSGIWNTKEAWPMMLSTAGLIGCLPDLENEPLDWLPVDIAAKAFLQAAQNDGGKGAGMHVCHVLNPHRQPQWHEMLQWLEGKANFDIVSPQEWIACLETCLDTEHSAIKLLGLWKEAYGNAAQEKKHRPEFSLSEARKCAPALRDVRPVDKAYMGKIWEWVQSNVR